MMPLLTAFILLYGVNIILTFDLFYIEFRIDVEIRHFKNVK